MYNVLVVENELAFCCELSLSIDWESLGFMISEFCRDGITAKEKLETEHYDLLICDIHVPGMSGLDLIHWMRVKEITIPVIIITAYAKFDYAQRAIEDSVSAYLLKPINEVLLVEILRRVKMELDNSANENIYMAPPQDVVAEAIKEIHNNCGKNLTIESLSRKLYVTPKQLNSLFGKRLNLSVKAYINNVRMEQACFLLERTDKRVYEIAREIGITDINYFTKLFRSNTGLTPSAYRLSKAE